MTAFTLGEATALALGAIGTGRRARHAVRRDSIEAGTFEHRFFVAPAKGEADRMLRAARAALDAGRRLKREARREARALAGPERALAALTAGAVRVFEEICTLARLNGGRVFPSYDRLAAATALGRATVARAIGLLEAAGFLTRQRRFKRIAAAGAGPRYAQTSNAYRPALPQRLLAFLPRWLRQPPLPDDVAQHVQKRQHDLAAMHDMLSARDLASATVGGDLGRMLARLGAAVDAAERESHDEPEPLSKISETAGASGKTGHWITAPVPRRPAPGIADGRVFEE